MAAKKPVEPKITRRSIADYLEDHANANKGSERGLSMVEESLSQDGAGRSIVVDADDRIVAGNKTWEASALAGIEDVIEVETDGHSLIVHKRRDWDLTDVQGAARRYAYRDNRASEVSLTWDAEQLLADVNAGFDFEHLFSEGELAALLANTGMSDVLPPENFAEYGDDIETQYCCPKCQYRWSGKPNAE